MKETDIAPSSPGGGVRIGRMQQIFAQGSLNSTGVATDLALSGDGFFVVQGDNGQMFLTRADREAGNSPLGAERAVAAWTLHLRGMGAPFNDARADKIGELSTGSLEESVGKVCDFLEISDRDSKASILFLAGQLGG